MEVRIVPASLESAFVLSTTMRANDVRELEACGQTPLEGLLLAMREGHAWTVLYDDVVGAMFGVRPLADAVLGGRVRGEIWCLTGRLFGEKPIAFVRAAKRAVAALLTQYDELVNLVDARYVEAVGLLRMLGARLGPEVLVGSHPFIAFSIGRA